MNQPGRDAGSSCFDWTAFQSSSCAFSVHGWASRTRRKLCYGHLRAAWMPFVIQSVPWPLCFSASLRCLILLFNHWMLFSFRTTLASFLHLRSFDRRTSSSVCCLTPLVRSGWALAVGSASHAVHVVSLHWQSSCFHSTQSPFYVHEAADFVHWVRWSSMVVCRAALICWLGRRLS